MSWLGRILGPAPAAQPRRDRRSATVEIPADLAQALTRDGAPLGEAVITALRRQLTPPAAPVAVTPPPVAAEPFWIGHDHPVAGGADLEDALRQRVRQRRAAEADS